MFCDCDISWVSILIFFHDKISFMYVYSWVGGKGWRGQISLLVWRICEWLRCIKFLIAYNKTFVFSYSLTKDKVRNILLCFRH